MRNTFIALLICLTTSWLSAAQVQLETSLSHPTMKAGSDGKQTNFLKVSLKGFDAPTSGKRAPVNVAMVIDKSGSMSGEKIAAAKAAALQAIGRLDAEDIVSIVTYDSTVTVLLPATKASDRNAIRHAIQQIQAGGNTALFAGVSKGAAEVRKFKSDRRVNRVILLSDGLANVGPSSPDALAELGSSLLEEGITVSTLGLGLDYNEDLMTRLAVAASGNHIFIEQADDVAEVFRNEFDDVLSVVAKDFHIRLKLADGVRPVKLLSSGGEIDGQNVDIRLGQLYARQKRYYLLEIEVPPGEHRAEKQIASVSVNYVNMQTETKDELSSKVAVRFDESADKIAKDENADVVTACAILTCNERNRVATQLRDKGDVAAAKALLLKNTDDLKGLERQYGNTDSFKGYRSQVELGISANKEQSENLEGAAYSRSRKTMLEIQSLTDQQQSYGGKGKVEAGQKSSK